MTIRISRASPTQTMTIRINVEDIILPIPFSINKNPYAIKSEITRSEEWKTTQYSMISHNCVDLVKFYLEKLGYPAKKHGFTQTIRPHRYVDEVRELGKNLVGQIIQHIRNSIDKNDDNDFSLENENINQIEIPPLLKNELEKPPFNISLSSNSIDKEVYCQILEILAKKHYDREEPQDRYAELFQETLNICPQLMNFTYKDNSKFSFKDYAKDLGLSLSALAITFIVTPITFVISPFIVFGEFLVELTKKTPENLTDDLKKLAKYTLIGLKFTSDFLFSGLMFVVISSGL